MFATVLFGQLQISDLISRYKSNVYLLIIALTIYVGIVFFGGYEIIRIKFYARRTIEYDIALRNRHPQTFNVQKEDFENLMGPALHLKNHLFDHTYRIVLLYTLISIAIISLSLLKGNFMV